MSEARSITNMIGNTVATFAIAKWDGSFDSAKFHAYYRNPVIGEDAEQAGSTPGQKQTQSRRAACVSRFRRRKEGDR